MTNAVVTDVSDALDQTSGDTTLISVHFSDDALDVGGRFAPWASVVEPALRRGAVSNKLYDVTLFHSDGDRPGLCLVGGGSRVELGGMTQLRLAASVSRFLTGRSYDDITWLDTGWSTGLAFGRAIAEGSIAGAYDCALRKTDQGRHRRLTRVAVVTDREPSDVAAGLAEGRVRGEAGQIARDLVNMPANELTPVSLAWKAEQLGGQYDFQVEVLDETHMDDLGMGALLGVASGSSRPPRLICLHTGNRGAQIRLALVGKGVTFDSGGLQIKTSEGMVTMKGDMGGGAAVLGAVVAVSRLGLSRIAVSGYIGAVENMPGGNAMRPGDVLTSMDGKTIEVLSTDAEGRLVLADVLTHAVRTGATHVVDVATLTAGARIALGSAAFLAAGRPAHWVDTVVASADEGLERAWAMPLYPEYRRAMDSDIADIKNTGGRAGTSLNAAAFLAEFADSVPWAHLDIAPTAWAEEAAPFRPKGATGSGVGTLIALAQRLDLEQS